MLDFIQGLMKSGYVDEHGHKLFGAAAISHLVYRPISSISEGDIEAGKEFVQKYLGM